MLKVHSNGSLRGLPVYPESPELTGLTAIVTGANGITGSAMVRVLAEAPRRWKKIYCLSRRPPSEYTLKSLGEEAASRIEHMSCDFLSEPQELAAMFKRSIPHIDYVFFFSYMQPRSDKSGPQGQWSNAEELTKVNSELLSRFLSALSISGLLPRRFLLQTGAKYYGFHYGPTFNPSFETDGRVTNESNFYYAQEDALIEFCQQHSVQWNVVRPSFIIGAAQESALNHIVGLSIYAAVQAHLKKPLMFPGDYTAWDREHCQSTALLNSYLEEWAALSPNTGNEAFNMQDGSPFTYGRLWQYLAQWYGTNWTRPETDESRYHAIHGTYDVPPRGYGPRGTTRYSFTFTEWSQSPEVKQAWEDLKQKYGLSLDPFAKRHTIFGQTDAAVIGGWPLSLSMRKARKMGWNGFADSYESVFNCLNEMARMKIVVPTAQEEWAD